MKKRIKILVSTFLSLIMLFSLTTTASAATVKLSWWTLVDVGGHLDWRDDGTKYLSNWKSGVNLWNAYTPHVIREDTSSTINDVAISDVNEVNNTNATATWYTGLVEGTIKFNIYNMDNLTYSQRTAVAAHECGHALGLDHNTSSDIMYEYTPLVTQLSVNDKASYDASWAAFGRSKPSSRMINGEARNTEATHTTYFNGLPVYFSESSYYIDIENFEDMVGHADYVFVGKVVNQTGEEYKNLVILEGKDEEYEWGDPYTNYIINVVENIKGSLDSDIELQQFGGLDQSRKFYSIPSGTTILTEDETYIFFAYAQEDGSLLVRGKNSAVVCDSDVLEEVKNAVENQTVFARTRFVSNYED